MSRDSRYGDGGYDSDERDASRRGGTPPRGPRSNGGRVPSDPGASRRQYGPPGSQGSGYRNGPRDGSRSGRPPSSDPRGYGASGYTEMPPRRSRGSRDDYSASRADYSVEREQAPRPRRRGFGDMVREMSRQMSAMVRGTGRVVRNEASRITSAGAARPQLPPALLAQIQNTDLPRFRRSRIRLRARKWRLGRVRANPVAYSLGLGSIALSLVAIIVGGGAGGVYAYNYYNIHRPGIQAILNNAISGQNTVIYDRNGIPIFTVRNDNSGYNYYAPLSQIGQTIQDATLDTEDHSFYSPFNFGVDVQGTLRALVADVSAGGSASQGGSTITQQLVKNLVLHDTQKAWQRKVNEIILAIGVNGNYSKSQILEMYLNTIDYGDQNTGIEAAARNYFGLKPKAGPNGTQILANQQLSLAQAALLAGLPNAPTYYLPTQYSCDKAPCATKDWANPCVGDPTQTDCVPSDSYDNGQDGHEWLDYRRARVVLANMVTYGAITQKQADDALKQVENMLVNQQVKNGAGLDNGSVINTTNLAPSFVDYVIKQLQSQFGIDPDALPSAGLSVYTTLDSTLNTYVIQNIDYYINKNHTVPTCTYGDCVNPTNPPLAQRWNAHDAAAVVIDPYTGDVLAMVGTAKYGDLDPQVDGFYNAAVSPRSLGSSMKGLVYATAFQMGWNPGIMMQDTPICMPGTQDDNQDFTDTPACKGNAAYVPHNFPGDGYNGYVPIRDALANSLNIPAVEAMSFVGDTPELSSNFIDMARRLGITAGDPENNVPGLTAGAVGPTTALGAQSTPLIQLTNAYAAFANSGKHVPYRSILRVVDSAGNVWNAPTPKPAQVISPQSAYMLTSVLDDNQARTPGFNEPNPLEFPDLPGLQVASKTGTGSGKNGPSDIVTIGYSPYLAVGVWMGNADNSDMTSGILGIAGAGYVFHDVMDWAAKHYKWPYQTKGAFPIPSDLAMGAFGCNAGLAPYQGEASGTSGTGGSKGGTSSKAGVPSCASRAAVGKPGVNHLGILASPAPDIDWYIQGQQPLLS